MRFIVLDDAGQIIRLPLQKIKQSHCNPCQQPFHISRFEVYCLYAGVAENVTITIIKTDRTLKKQCLEWY